jgi:hypothetical protein
MQAGQQFELLGTWYEIVSVRGASIIAREVTGCGDLFWIIEDDLP